jgi:ribosomal-protein-alanine N-acetyltransferase
VAAEGAPGSLAGLVRLETLAEARSAELTYVVEPRHPGRGLATRMSWTVLQHAFGSGRFDTIVAGADVPNEASVRVMQRLGMSFRRSVRYPAGPGVEYVSRREDPAPQPMPRAIALREG